MRNGLPFSKLTLVESVPGSDDDKMDDNNDASAAYVPYQSDAKAAVPGSSENRLFIVMLTASLACAAATVVTGGYAVWLARQQAARQALTDVNDILRSCQSRMSQLETDLQRLPNRGT